MATICGMEPISENPYLHHIAALLPPGSLSRFRTADRFYGRALHETLVKVLVASASPKSPLRQRRSAVRALGNAAEKGDASAIAAVYACVEDDHWMVRSRAVRSLAQLVPKGDADAIAAASARLTDADQNVRRAALTALGKLAEKGHAGVIAAVSAHLADEVEDIRRLAVDVLGEIATKGDVGAIAAVSARFQNGPAVRVIEQILQREELRAGDIAAMLALLNRREFRFEARYAR